MKQDYKSVDLEPNSSDLPRGWIIRRLSEVAKINPRKPKGKGIDNNLKVSFIPMRCVEEITGNIDLSITRRYDEVGKGYTYFKNGDIIFAKITPCMENGKIAITYGLKNGIGFGSTEFHVIRLNGDYIVQKFYFHYLMQDSFRHMAQKNMKGTAGQQRVPLDYLENALVLLPPLSEQKRIVAKIESIFTQIDASQQKLEKLSLQVKSVHESLDMLKSSILKQAFEGKLVPQDPNDEPAGIFLEVIIKVCPQAKI